MDEYSNKRDGIAIRGTSLFGLTKVLSNYNCALNSIDTTYIVSREVRRLSAHAVISGLWSVEALCEFGCRPDFPCTSQNL
jgi:hypothetical protein